MKNIVSKFLEYSKAILIVLLVTTILTCIGITNRTNNRDNQFDIGGNKHTKYRSELESPNEEYLQKGLYIFTWTDFCQGTMERLKSWIIFPYYPMIQSFMIDELKFEARSIGNYAQRVFGYLKIPKTGQYSFRTGKIKSIEVWLSTDGSPLKTQQILSSETFKRVLLKKDYIYYIEIFFTISETPEIVLIEWLIPGQIHFESIKSEYLFFSPKLLDNRRMFSIEYLPHFQYKENKTIEEPNTNLFKLLPIPISTIQLYNECDYSPSYGKRRAMSSLYQGVNMVSNMLLAVYPDDGTSMGNRNIGNPKVSMDEVHKIFGDFKERLLESRKEVKNVQLIKLEKQFDPRKGRRYLIESEVTLESDHIKNYSFSYHIYAPNGRELCHPSTIRIYSDTFVHIAISVKNQGPWIQYFIENMEKVFYATGDVRFGILIIDFESDDVNMTHLIENSLLLNKHLITLTGPYSRTSSLNTAISYVQSDDDIIFMCDLHLDLPLDIIDVIRKHTFLGISGYAPAMFRLNCGYSTRYAAGKWEMLTYGMFSMFKADWVIVGGFDQERYKYQWGGEDWELLDRFLEKGYFVERFRQPKLFHYFHDRKSMWKA